MARTISDEQIKLSVIIDGNPAQKELHDVEKSIRDLNKQQTELRKEKQLLEKAGQKESARYREVTQAMRENTAAINANKSRMEQLQREIGLTGLTMAQLRSKATALRATLNNLIPGSEDYQRYNSELQTVNARISELRGNAQAAGFSLGRLADGVNRYAALGASVVAGLTGVALSVQKIIDLNGKLSDAQSNVMKTTGMTKQEVDELTKSFGLLETRTSRINLLGIAETGGRLGIPKEEIQDFVKVMDKASVALGDSFEGGPEIVAEKLGKIKGLYAELKDSGVELAFNSVGSAMNDLGAAGAASEENIADFVTRIGAMPEALKPSIGEALGLGAAFEESGLKAEVAATNYSKVIAIAARDTSAFAQVMGKSTKDIENLINTNPNEFFLQFADSLKKLSATDLAKTLDTLKLNDNEVKMVLGAAGKNAEFFREKIELANQSLADGTSLTKEFDIKNNNLAATLEKIQKTVAGFFSSESFINWLTSAVQWLAKFIGATEDSDGKVTAWRNTLAFTAKVIAIVTAAIVTNVAWQKLVAMWTTRNTEATLLYNIASKARAFADGVAVVSTQALAVAQNLLTGNLRGAALAFKTMTAAMMTTPWGFILGALAAITAAYYSFRKETENVISKEKLLSQVRDESQKAIRNEVHELSILVDIAKDETKSKEEREKAIKRINEISPEYLGNLTLETIKTLEAKDAIDKYIQSLDKKAYKEAIAAKRTELANKEREVRTGKEYSNYTPFLSSKTYNFSDVFALEDTENKPSDKVFGDLKAFNERTKGWSAVTKRAYNEYKQRIHEVRNELSILNEEEKKFIQENVGLYVNPTETTPDINLGGGGSGGKDKSPKEKKYDDSYLDQERRLREELIKLQQKSEEERIAILGEGYAKEMQMQIANFNNKQTAFKQESESIKSLQEQLNKDLIEAQKNGDTRKVASIKNMQQILLDKENELNKQMQYEEQMHYLKIGTIQEKAGQKQVEKIKSQYDQEKTARETAFLLELESLDLSEKEKQKRKEQFAKDELAFEEKMLNDQLNKLNSMLQNVEFDGIIFDLLSEEDKEKLKNDVILVQNAIAKLKAAPNVETDDEAKKEIDLGMSGQTDILGFSQEQWDSFFKNIEQGTIGFQTMAFAIQAAGQIFSQFDQYQTASENAQLKKYERGQDARKRALKRQLDAGQINQVQYKRKVEELDQELDRKKAEIEYKQAKRQRLMSIANVITSTAQAIMSIWAQVPKFDFGATAGILTGMVSAMGALQLATILKTPLPAKGFEQGLYPEDVVREQDGRKFKAGFGGRTKSGMVTKPTYFLAGENYKPEMVIDNKAYRDLSPYTRNLLINELRGIKGFENGYYNPQSMRIEVPEVSNTNNSSSITNDLLVSIIAENTEVMRELKDLKETGVIAYISKDFREMKKLQEQLDKYNSLKRNNKI